MWPASLAHLEKLRPRLDMAEDFVVFEGRTYIPESLREDALRNLHIGHQSCGSRIARASETLYWPGITADIRRFREECQVDAKLCYWLEGLCPLLQGHGRGSHQTCSLCQKCFKK